METGRLADAAGGRQTAPALALRHRRGQNPRPMRLFQARDAGGATRLGRPGGTAGRSCCSRPTRGRHDPRPLRGPGGARARAAAWLEGAERAGRLAAVGWDELARGRRAARRPGRPPEVWGAGVTYRRSADFREEGTGIYDRVYTAERPELFFKATAWRCVAHGEPIGRRRDSEFTAAEPEIAIVLGRSGAILGFTLANDVSAWDIERDNPLYLPQSKVYTGCFAFGPMIVTPDEIPDPTRSRSAAASCAAEREVFAGEATTGQLKRRFEELVGWLARSNEIRTGTVLSTGTGIIQPLGLRARGGRRGRALLARARRAREPRGARVKHDPYALRPEDVEEPPANAWRALPRLGPGMVLAAAIVGLRRAHRHDHARRAGGLRGAVGRAPELRGEAGGPGGAGRYTIATGETGLEALDRDAGAAPRGELDPLGLGGDRVPLPPPGRGHVRRGSRRS